MRMAEPDPSRVEQDHRFPSGGWRGYFVQPGVAGRSYMDLQLTFYDGRLHGTGSDWVGNFIILGRYQTTDGDCWWTKRYIGKHDVFYRGSNQNRVISGQWQLPPLMTGEFRIWPASQADPAAPRQASTAKQLDAELELELEEALV
jgi:hypothetical protein